METVKTLQAGLALGLCYALATALACAALLLLGIVKAATAMRGGRKAS